MKGGSDGTGAWLRKVRVPEPIGIESQGFQVCGHKQNGGWRRLIGSSHGADGFEEGLNRGEILGRDLTFLDQINKSEFEGAEVLALVDGDEEATEGDFNEFQKRNGLECGIGSDDEEAGLPVDIDDFDGLDLIGLRESGVGEFDDGLGAVGVDDFELFEGAVGQRQGHGAAWLVEFGRAPAQISMRHCV